MVEAAGPEIRPPAQGTSTGHQPGPTTEPSPVHPLSPAANARKPAPTRPLSRHNPQPDTDDCQTLGMLISLRTLAQSLPRTPARRSLACLLIAASCATALGQPPTTPAPSATTTATTTPAQPPNSFAIGEPYIRIIDSAPGQAKLQIASKTFTRAGNPGPVVHLTGAIHIADESFYTSLQKLLDSLDVVLFEGVRPQGGARLAPDATDAQRAEATTDRVKMVASLVRQLWESSGERPESLAAVASSKPKLKSIIDDLAIDGWGRPISLQLVPGTPKPDGTPGPDSVRVFSRGKGDAPGGDGHEADIAELVAAPAGKAAKTSNLQERLAKAFGLAYQGEAMNTGKPNWRSSDLSIDQIIKRAKESGSDASLLLSMLDGKSLMAQLGGFVLGFIEASPTLRATAKITLIEALAHADPASQGAALGKSGAGLMKVIIEDRNDIVLDDLAKIIQTEPEIRSVSAFYGAGHMEDMEKKLAARFGYVPGEVLWIDAVTLDAKQLGVSERDFKRMRETTAAQMKTMSGKPDDAPKRRTRRGPAPAEQPPQQPAVQPAVQPADPAAQPAAPKDGGKKTTGPPGRRLSQPHAARLAKSSDSAACTHRPGRPGTAP